MKNKIIIGIFLLLFTGWAKAQQEQYPLYPNCENQDNKRCFLDGVKKDFNANFEYPSSIEIIDFSIVFLASKEGNFQVLYVSSPYKLVKEQVIQTFKQLPNFQPATFNSHPIDKRFILPFRSGETNDTVESIERKDKIERLTPVDRSVTKKLIKKEGINYSPLRIPLSHQTYNQFSEFEFSENAHTAIKPYTYQTVSKATNLNTSKASLLKGKTSWLGRKFLNENMLDIEGDGYWFHLDPAADLQIGKDNSETAYTYNNTRAIRIEGGFGKKIGFSSTLYESQGRFAEYFNDYSLYKKPNNSAYAIVPSRDISKKFNTDAFDYPVATASLSFTPYKFLNIQFGHDKNFIGDGYRSLFLSDVGAPYTYLKLNTNFWKIQYTNIWTWLRDVNTTTANDEPYKRKYMAMHYLSWNATKNFNLGLFESVIWAKTPERGFDPHYLNPIIIYRALEFSNGSRAGNALLGLSANYRFKNTIHLYSQFVLDELSINKFVNDKGYWANKYGIQVGTKYYNAFKIPRLTLQAEYNQVRPFTYSHNKPVLNYGHVNQPLAHLWESNFKEITFITSYQINRWFGTVKLISGSKGFDINSDTDTSSYGGNIFRTSSDKNSPSDVFIGQGNKANILIGELQAGYIINPATNLKIFGSLLYRDFKTPIPNDTFENKTTTWFNVGFRTDLNNWYFDF